MNDDHSCTANFEPAIDSHQGDEPILSATIGDAVEVYGECRVCGQKLTVEYEYADAYPS